MRCSLAIGVLLLAGCASDLAPLEAGEELPGGAGTNTLLLGANAFLRPAENLSSEDLLRFYGGNSFFNDNWVEAPASTANRDGLGPHFNARSCSGCHFRDGRAAPPEEGDSSFLGLRFRISTQTGGPDPTYGGQLQDGALPGLTPEVRLSVAYRTVEGTVGDGMPYELIAPEYTIEPLQGPFSDGLQRSPRIAPHMVGLGLLEAIPLERLEALADPDDTDGDGISGRLQWRDDARTGARMPGRFGWKGDAPTVEHQVAGAFRGDLGITSSLFPADDCTEAQTACRTQANGGEPELEERLLDRTVLYSQAVAVPVRRGHDDDDVRRGKRLFGAIGCDGCHVGRHVTGYHPVSAMVDQVIWPYTDLLLHDMGPELADGRPLGEADGREWKTPPLWGLGLVPAVNGHSRYLHDGRARSLEEAVLWHGGEASASRDAYRELSADERSDVVRFLESL